MWSKVPVIPNVGLFSYNCRMNSNNVIKPVKIIPSSIGYINQSSPTNTYTALSGKMIKNRLSSFCKIPIMSDFTSLKDAFFVKSTTVEDKHLKSFFFRFGFWVFYAIPSIWQPRRSNSMANFQFSICSTYRL